MRARGVGPSPAAGEGRREVEPFMTAVRRSAVVRGWGGLGGWQDGGRTRLARCSGLASGGLRTCFGEWPTTENRRNSRGFLMFLGRVTGHLSETGRSVKRGQVNWAKCAFGDGEGALSEVRKGRS